MYQPEQPVFDQAIESNIEITNDNIKAFESTAKKYGIDFALKKDSSEQPPRYLVFSRDGTRTR